MNMKKSNFFNFPLGNKKAITYPYEFLVGLIIALVVFIPTVLFASQFFRLSDQALDSYNKFAGLIESVDEGELESIPLYMDKGTAIVGFSKDNDLFVVKNSPKENAGILLKMEKSENLCMEGRACLCLCRKGLEFIRSPPTFECKKMICNELPENLDFAKNIPKEVKEIKTWQLYHDGFMIYNDKKAPTNLGLIQYKDRLKTIYIERKNDKIYICEKSPCITAEMIEKREKAEYNEFEYHYFVDDLIGVDYYHEDGVADRFYYIIDHKKDIFEEYYYEYKFGMEGEFSTKITTESADTFENRLIDYVKRGKFVKIDHSNKGDMTNFNPSSQLKEDGNFGPVT
ncbi:MAG: hypothetical protein KAU20_02800 [Nanoarchaeota archaeon]|nr:hypothetical protein [Nanoarchaeota archaeon]